MAIKSVRLVLDLDAELRERLDLAAKQQGITIEDLCVQAIVKELALEEQGTESAETYVELLALTRRRRQLERITVRKKPDSTDYIAEGRGRLSAIDLISGDELEAYREHEYARIVGEIRPPTEEEKAGSLKALEKLAATRERLFQGRTLPGDSVDLIREAREERSEYLDQTFGSS